MTSAEHASSPHGHPGEDENGLDGENHRSRVDTFQTCTTQTSDREHASLEDLPTSRQDGKPTDQRQEEEEEEELEIEEETKEEEEETSQGQGDLELGQNEDASPKSAVFSVETESDLLDVVMSEKSTFDAEEPTVQARRTFVRVFRTFF